MQYQAVVFDMDGVIFDTERLVIEFWKEVAKCRTHLHSMSWYQSCTYSGNISGKLRCRFSL